MSAIQQITSSSNPFYKLVKKLMADKSCRRENMLFVAEGKRLVADALISGLHPRTLLTSERFAREHRDDPITGCCGDRYILSDKLMASLGDTQTPQGILGLFPIAANDGECLDGKKLIFLHSLQDPGNVGTIIRTAQALGISRVLLSEDCPDMYAPKVLRASMGGVFRGNTTVVQDIKKAIRSMQASGTAVYAAALRDGAREIGSMRFSENVCVVIGNEGAGIPDEIIDCCDGVLMIPMPGQAQSLNAAMAAGILIWEMTKENDSGVNGCA